MDLYWLLVGIAIGVAGKKVYDEHIERIEMVEGRLSITHIPKETLRRSEDALALAKALKVLDALEVTSVEVKA